MPSPQYNSPLQFPQESGIVEALQNDLTLRASSSGNVIISQNALRPEIDVAQDLGTDALRWRNLYSANGTFSFRPTVSGVGLATLADLIDSGQTSVQGLSGVVALDSPNDTISIVVNGQTVELDGIFTWGSGQLLESLADASGVQSLNNISGIIDLVAANNGVTVTDNGQVIELTTLFTYASGQLVDQNTQDILIVSGLLGGGDSGQTSINGLSGTLVLTSPDGSILIGDGPQAIQLSGLFTQASGAVLQQHSEDLLTLSGLIPGGAGGNGQTSINGLSGVTFLTSPDGSILIGDNGQTIELSGLFTPESGVLVNRQIHERRWQGVVSGFDLSVNATNSGLFDISEGLAYVSGLRVEFSAQSGLDPTFPPPGSGDSCIYTTIGIDFNGNIVRRQGAVFDHDVLARTVAIGTILSGDAITPSSGFIQEAHSENYNILNGDMHEISWMHSVMGSLVASGMQALEIPTLQLAIGEGVFYDEGRGRKTIPSENPLEWCEVYNDALGNLRIQGMADTIRNDVYDDGFGLQPLIGNRFASHTLWYNHIRDDFFLVISRGDYASLQLAQDAPLDRGCMVDHGDVMPIAKIIIQRASTTLQGDAGRIVDKRRVVGGREAGGAGATVSSTATTLQQAYDNSSVTEITVDVTRGALTVADDTVPLCNFGLKTFEVTDNAKEIEYFGVCASGFITPSGHIRGALSIAMDPVGPARCSLDVSGLICASGLEIVHERPTLSGIGLATLADIIDTQMTLNGLSGAVTVTSPDGSILIGDAPQTIELSGLFTAASGSVLQQHSQDLVDLSGLIFSDGGQTSVNGLSGTISISGINLQVTTSGQTILVSGIMNAASGAILEQRGRDIDTLSGLIIDDNGQTSINGVSGVVTLASPDGTVIVTPNGQTIELEVLPDAGQTSANGLSGVVTIDAVNNGINVNVNGQSIEISTLFTYTSGQIIDQNTQDILTLSGISTSHTSINGLSGVLTLTSPDGSILIGDGPQAIELSGLFTGTSGALVQQHSADLLNLSGLILPDGGQTSVEGISGVIDLDSPDGTVIIDVNGQAIELTVLPDAGQTSINSASGALSLVAGNNGIVVNTTDPTITLSPLFTYTSGQIIDQHSGDLLTLSGLILADSGQTSIEGLSGVVDLDSPDGTVIIGVNGQAIELTVLPDAGQTSANGLSGALTLTSPDNSILIGDNGQSIELSGLFTPASGAVLQQKCEDINTLSGLIPSSSLNKTTLEFTDTSGTSFVMYHGLNTPNFTWNMWEQDDGGNIQNYVLPKTLRPSGVDHVEVGLSAAMVGTLIILG
tara:strand:+ start:37508 stop:41389 length:3882 start_codon:yes stop_codon:yes gene_type:complete